MLWHEPRVEPPATKTSSASSSSQNEMFGVEGDPVSKEYNWDDGFKSVGSSA